MASFLEKIKSAEITERLFPVAKTLLRDFQRADLFKQASAMAYVTLLSLVPSLAAIFSLISVFKPLLGENGDLTNTIRQFILDNLAGSTSETVTSFLENHITNLDFKRIGVTSVVSLLVTLVLLLRQIEQALNRIWLVRKGRNPFARFMHFWTFITFGTFLLSIGVGLSSHLGVAQTASWESTSWVRESGVFTYLSGFVFFLFLYKVVPNCRVGWPHAALGALISTILFRQVARFWGIYVQDFSGHQAIYGALAALPLFLTWLYICWIIILSGAVISWRTQQGMPTSDKKPQDQYTSNPVDRIHSLRLRSLNPVLTMLCIHAHFLTGRKTGVLGHDIQETLQLPPMWIEDALEALEDLRYVVGPTEDADDNTRGSMLDRHYFPTTPVDRVSIKEFCDDLLAPLDVHLKHLQIDLPKIYREALLELSQVASDPEGGRLIKLVETLSHWEISKS